MNPTGRCDYIFKASFASPPGAGLASGVPVYLLSPYLTCVHAVPIIRA